MKKIALGLFLASGIGCVHIQPVGPMADYMGSKKPADAPQANVKVKPAEDVAQKPIIQAASPPAPPALLVTPGEVTEANVKDAAKRLMAELETDRKAMESMPKYAEVSTVKGSR